MKSLSLAGRLYPKWNNGRFRKVNFPPRVQAKDDVNVDYRGLESTFGVPRSSPGPPGKGSTKCHLGLRKCQAAAWHFRFTPQEESGAFGRRILLPPPLRGCPQGLPGEDPRTPSVGFALEVWNLSFFSRLIIRQLKKHWFRTLSFHKGFGTGHVVTIYR